MSQNNVQDQDFGKTANGIIGFFGSRTFKFICAFFILVGIIVALSTDGLLSDRIPSLNKKTVYPTSSDSKFRPGSERSQRVRPQSQFPRSRN